MATSGASLLNKVNLELKKGRNNIPDFRPGDTIKVHARIIEGQKERVQVFQGLVIKRNNGKGAGATFTVRKISFNVGVERTFYLYSPRIDKIEVVSHGTVRRSKLFYLRPLRGKAARIKSTLADQSQVVPAPQESDPVESVDSEPIETSQDESTQSAPA